MPRLAAVVAVSTATLLSVACGHAAGRAGLIRHAAATPGTPAAASAPSATATAAAKTSGAPVERSSPLPRSTVAAPQPSASAPAAVYGPQDVSVTLTNLGDDRFDPSPVTVRPGDSVTWSDGDRFGCAQTGHTITSTSSNWSVDATIYCDTAVPGSQESFTYTFRVPGTYTYRDKFSTATGEVLVKSG